MTPWRLWDSSTEDSNEIVATDDDSLEPPAGKQEIVVNGEPTEEQMQLFNKHGFDFRIIRKPPR